MNEIQVASKTGVFIVVLALVLHVFVHAKSTTGQDEYTKYCAACHGSDGKGDGD